MDAHERVELAISEIKKGNMIVMVDDEDRENEGDIVYASTFSTPEKVNFIISEAKGILCTPISAEIAKKLNFEPMVKDNTSCHSTAFTISVDTKEAKTGVSAFERDDCIKKMANPNAKATQFVKPGHIFPLIAKDGGVLVRTGHTEGSVDICRLSGLYECAVCCEIVKPDGEMARRDDLEKFCAKHNLHMVSVSDIVEYRLSHESLIRVFAEENVEFQGVKARKYDILDYKERHHVVYTFGVIKKTTNVKFHAVGSDLELFKDQKLYQDLTQSIKYLQENSGVLVFLDVDALQENKDDTMKEFGIGAQILRYLGVKNIELLTQSESKRFAGLSGFGLVIKNEVRFN